MGEKWINGVAQLLDPMTEAFLGKESWLSFTLGATQHGEATEEKGSRGALGCPRGVVEKDFPAFPTHFKRWRSPEER